MNPILIVDDSEQNLYLLEKMLCGYGYKVEKARHGAEALAKARFITPELVVSDLMMPVMDGFTLLRHWKSDDKLRSIPFLVYTATYTEPEDERLAKNLGADAFVLKPAEPEAFIACIQKLINGLKETERPQNLAETYDSKLFIQDYNATLIRKLEKKMLQLEEANGRLKEDIVKLRIAEEKIQHVSRFYAISSAINEAIVRYSEPNELFSKVCEIAVDAGGFELSWIGLRETSTGNITPVAHMGRKESSIDLLGLSAMADDKTGKTPGDIAIKTGKPVWYNDIAVENKTFASKIEASTREFHSCAAFPLFLDDEPVGIFEVFSKQVGLFGEEEIHVLHALAENLSFAMTSHHHEIRRKEAENALKTSETNMAHAQHIAHFGSWFLDLSDPSIGSETPIHWSDEMFRITGLEPGSVTVTRSSFLQMVHPEDRDLVLSAVQKAIEKRKPYEIVHRLIRSDGKERIIHEVAEIFYDDSTGKPLKMVGTAHDITERKKMEEQYLRTQRIECIGTLASGIAHDLNNILTPILMYVDLLSMEVKNTEYAAIIPNIRSSAQRGAELVKQILSFARGVEGHRVTVNPIHLIREITNIVRDTFPKNINLSLENPLDVWPVEADPTQLHQVLLNLCVNARDAMPNGGKLVLTVKNCEIDDVFASMNPQANPGHYVALSVGDSGLGMEKDVINRIFEPFFTTKDTGKGTGIGLSTVQAIVKSHGGFLHVYSEKNQGSVFKVYLPAVPNAENPTDTPVKPEGPGGHGELILIVDDEEGIRLVMKRILEQFGYRTLLAENGVEGVELFARYSNDIVVVLTDVAMPIMNGPSMVKALQSIRTNIKVIATSGHDIYFEDAKNTDNVIRSFITKPFTSELLLRTLREVIEN